MDSNAVFESWICGEHELWSKIQTQPEKEFACTTIIELVKNQDGDTNRNIPLFKD